MERAHNQELAKRVNLAFMLLCKKMPVAQIIIHLTDEFGVSKIQAYRYIQQAKENKEQVAIPEVSVVFTVKQPPSLVNKVREFADTKGVSISKVVKTALEEFLAKTEHGQKAAN